MTHTGSGQRRALQLVLNKRNMNYVYCDPPSCFCTGVYSVLRVSRSRGNIWFGAKHFPCNTFQDR